MANSQKVVKLQTDLGADTRASEAVREYFASVSSGLTHVHTNASNHHGHHESDLELAAYVKLLGEEAEYVAISDHTSNPAAPHRLDKGDPILNKLDRQLAAAHKTPKLIYGAEVSILPDGQLDVPDSFMAGLDFVIASHHGLPEEIENDPAALTAHFIASMQRPGVDVLGHPSRYVTDLPIDWPAIFEAAKRHGTAIEININNYPIWPHWWHLKKSRHYLQFWLDWLKDLAESGVAITLGSDVHTNAQLYQYLHWVHSLERPRRHFFRQRLARLMRDMQQAGIEPTQVVSRDYDTFVAWLDKTKKLRKLAEEKK